MELMINQLKAEVRPTLKLAAPLVIAFLGYQLISLVDTFVAGRLGVDILAAVSLGSALFWVLTIFPLGLLMSLDPVISQALGAGKHDLAWRACRRGMGLALLMAFVTVPLYWFSSLSFWPWSNEGTVGQALQGYTLGRLWCIPFLLLHVCLRCFLQAHERGGLILLGTILSNVLNFILSVYLGGGDLLLSSLGLPSIGYLSTGLGAFGVGLASSIVILVEVIFLGIFSRQLGTVDQREGQSPPLIGAWKELIRLGAPIGGAMLSEGGVFSASTLIVSAWSPVMIGAHQVTLQLASSTFTICLGIASATSVRVGLAVGASHPERARAAGLFGISLSLFVMLISATCFVLFGHVFAGLISLDPSVIKLSGELLMIAAAFQVFDGIQVTAAAALRGTGQTRIQLISAMISHWGVGLTTSLIFAFGFAMKVHGLWWGLCCGLICASGILVHAFITSPIDPIDD